MRCFKFICSCAVIWTATACSDILVRRQADGSDIQLGACIGEIQTVSRSAAGPFIGSNLSPDHPFEAAVWFRKDGGKYEHNPDSDTETYLPVHTSVKFTGQILDVYYGTNNLQYPTTDAKVYCIGLYPNKINDADGGSGSGGGSGTADGSGWTQSGDLATVSHPIDGATDLMFAKEIEGSWNNHFPTQNYEHLLTWIKINVCATSHDTADAWGKIKQISINSESVLTIDLQGGSVNCETPAAQAPYEIKAIGASSPSVALKTTMQEVGSVLCSPKTEYVLKVKTENNEDTKEITLKLNTIENGRLTPLTDSSQARGKCFVLSLYFKPYNVIEGICSLNSWNNQNDDIYLTQVSQKRNLN